MVGAVIVAGFAAAAWYRAADHFTCPGVTWTIDYAGAGSGYFGMAPPTGCLGYPADEPTGYGITLQLTLTNTAPLFSHQVTSISVSAPSVMNSISPSLPVTVAVQGSANFTLEVTIPTLTGDYVVAGQITTS